MNEASGVTGATDHPTVAVIMTVVNEERHLAQAVQCIRDQDYPGQVSLAIAVGPSRDRTREVAQALAADDPSICLVDNPSGRTPIGLNAAIAASTSQVVVRVDGHAMLPPDYVSVAVATLARTGAVNVGGVMAAQGITDLECAVARAMTSAFGVGGAAFHIGGAEGPADTVYLGSFLRSALQAVNGYDETMDRAQDWEMNYRLRQAGGTIWFTPRMQVTYRPRASLSALARQYLDYGRWRREVARRYPQTVSLRYLAAPLAFLGVSMGLAGVVLGTALGLGLGWWWLAALGAVPVLGYLGANALASALTAWRPSALGWRSALMLPVVYGTMHMSWGLGFLLGPASRRDG